MAKLRRSLAQDAGCLRCGSRQGAYNFFSYRINTRTINLIYSFARQSEPQLDCNYKVNSNTCYSVAFPDDLNYGPPFNDNGGGWYGTHNKQFQWCLRLVFPYFHRFAVERTDTAINIWFWSRSSFFVPSEVKSGSDTVDPDGWVCENYSILVLDNIHQKYLAGLARCPFPDTFCDFLSHFSEENIIINLTLCKLSLFYSVLIIVSWSTFKVVIGLEGYMETPVAHLPVMVRLTIPSLT